jgi:cytochrome c553
VWAAACAHCPGTEGRAETGRESLAAKDKDVMLQKLMDFKSGRKPATIMHLLSKGYTDEQLAQIVGYFAAQKK